MKPVSLHKSAKPQAAESTAVAAPPTGIQDLIAQITNAIPAPAGNANLVFQSLTPYVFFPYMISQKTWQQVAQKFPQHQQARPILVTGGEMYQLSPFSYVLLSYEQWFAEENKEKNGEIVRTSRDSNAVGKDPKEYIETLLLVFAPDGRLVPARASFKKMLVGGVYGAIKALAHAQTPEWGRESPAHEATLAVSDPRFRFKATMIVNDVTAKSTGRLNQIGSCRIEPTGLADWKAIGETLADPNVMKDLLAAQRDYQKRLEELESKLVKQ